MKLPKIQEKNKVNNMKLTSLKKGRGVLYVDLNDQSHFDASKMTILVMKEVDSYAPRGALELLRKYTQKLETIQ